MYFESVSEIAEIAARTGTAIFVVPDGVAVEIKQAVVLQPEGRATITIDQVRQATARLGMKQVRDTFVVVRPADKLGVEAANAFLKNLEEPGEKVHYVLITEAPSRLPATILSRAAVYFWRGWGEFKLEVEASESKKQAAKQLIAAGPQELVKIAEGVAKKKDKREAALELLALAIEMLEKSYFVTGKEVFVRKLPKFLRAYENIMRNGHVKLHLIADLC